MFKLSFYHVVTPILEELGSPPSRIIYSSRTGRSLTITDLLYQKLCNAQFEDIASKTLSELIYNELLVPVDEHEFHEVLAQNHTAIKDEKNLDITIQPTANCQLGCHYCGQVHSQKKMSDEYQQKTVDRIKHNLSQKAYKSIAIEWYGGEPLLALPGILSMSEELISHCDTESIRYQAEMITNGLIFKKETFLKLLKARVTHYQITLDGQAEFHDTRRITKKGAGTFDIIFKNVLEVIKTDEFDKSGATITLRINIDYDNYLGVEKLIDLFAAHGIQHKRVGIDFVGVVNWGDNHADKNSLSAQDFADKRIDWLLYAMQKGFVFGDLLPRRIAGPCMVVKEHAEVYDAFGNIYPCYEFPYTPKYEQPAYKIGHLDTIDKEKNEKAITKNWLEDVKTDIATCRTCNLFPVCGGGCPKMWYNEERACPSYKNNMEDLLVLDYLMKKNDNHVLVDALQPEKL